jgi:hypothetical protein
MKFTEKRVHWSPSRFIGRKNGFEFSYSLNGQLYVYVSHTKKDIRFNSLWEQIMFVSEKQIQEWCEEFDYTQHDCLGSDTTSPH